MNYESIRSVDQIPARMNAHHIKEMGARAMLGLKVRNSVFTDVDELSKVTFWEPFRVTPLRYPFSLETSDLDLSDLALQTGRSTPLAVLGALPPGTAWLLIPLDGHESLCSRRGAAGPHGVAVFGPGAEYEVGNRHPVSWGLVMLPAARIDWLLSPPQRSAIRRPGGAAWLRADPGAWVRAAALLRETAEVMAQDPDVFQVAEARRSLRASLLEACDELLGGPYGGREPRELPIASPLLRRTLRAADDYLHANPARAVDLAQLSVAIGAPEVRLRSAFLVILGISVTRYLLVRRLMLVRAALRSPDRSWASVEDAALAHGFWNGQRFQRAYRAVFGEAPHKP